MGRQKNDGRGRLGGRAPGTPNKENPLKGYLRSHSAEYFKPRLQVDADGEPKRTELGLPLVDSEGNPVVMSDFEIDLLAMEPEQRVLAEIRLLEFHTPKMKAVDIDMNLRGSCSLSIEERLRQLINPQDKE